MADFDEEIRRQAAISALLAPPEEEPPVLDTQANETFTNPATGDIDPVIRPKTQADYHKLVDQAFPNISPPPPEPADVKTDEDTGTRYVQDPLEGKIPHAELATEADKEAFKPSDVTLPEITTLGQDVAPQVKRGEEWREPWHPSTPDPTQGNLGDEDYIRQILTATPTKAKPVPGFVPGSQNAILNPAAGVIKPDPTQGNFGDEELARQILAPDKPVPRAQPAVPKADIVQDPIVTRSIAKNIADQSAAVPAPAPGSSSSSSSSSSFDPGYPACYGRRLQ